MKNTKIPSVVFEFQSIGPLTKLVLLYLYKLGNRCYPTYSDIRADLGVSRATISKAFKDLERLNILSRTWVQLEDFDGSSDQDTIKVRRYTIKPISDWNMYE